jgi:hypothetical protein
MIHGDACFAYFNKIWGIPPEDRLLVRNKAQSLRLSVCSQDQAVVVALLLALPVQFVSLFFAVFPTHTPLDDRCMTLLPN